MIAQNFIESCVRSGLIRCSSNQTGKFVFVVMWHHLHWYH